MYLGIDLGTSSMKCLLIGEDQEPLKTVSSEEISLSSPHHGWSEQDPKLWIQALDQCLLKLRQEINLKQIKSISFSGHMHGATCLDKNNQVLRPCMMWNDTRSHQECKEIMSNKSVLNISGNIAMPGFTAPKVLWLKHNDQKLFDQIYKVLLPKDYLRFYLTGEYFSDLSDAAGTYWLDVGQRKWSSELLEASSMQLNQMPTLCEGTEQTGILKKEVADQYGFDAKCKVYGGAGDNAAAAVGLGLFEEGNASLSLGTSGVIFGSTKNFLKNYDDAIHSFCHCLPNTWHLMSVMLSCTSNINWFKDTFDSTIEEITKDLSQYLNSKDKIINAPYFLPYLTGERTPINDPHVRASFHQMGIDSDRASLIYALIEGISFGLNNNYQALSKTGIKLENIFAIGGGSKNESWLQLLASILNRNLSLTDASDAMAAFGAARIAYMGFNNLKPNEALSTPKVIKIIEKDPQLYEMLNERFQIWKKFYIKNE
jgi:xylulokinase